MWVMLITFFFYANPVSRESTVSLATAEFSSQATCEAARQKYLAQFSKDVDMINTTAGQGISSGTLMGPNGMTLTALCVKK